MRTRIARFAAGFMALALLLGGLGALSLDTAKAALTLTVSDKYAVKDGTFTVTIVDTETSGVTDGTAASPTTVSVKVKNKNRGVTATMTPQDAGTDAKTFTMTVTVKEQAAAVTTVGSEIIPGFEGDTIEISYVVFTKSLLVDNIAPSISASVPAKGAVTKPGTVTFSADIIDTGSGFSAKSSEIDDFSATHGKLSVTLLGAVINQKLLTYSAIDDGWNISYSASLGTSGSSTAIPWSITSIDRAGNTKTLDRSTASTQLTVDGKKPALKTTFTRTEGATDVSLTTRTGAKWSASGTGVSDPTTGGSLTSNRAKTGAYRKNLLVIFEEAGGLDTASVDASDFTVVGGSVISAVVVDVLEDSKTAPSSTARRPQEVYLTLADNLASDAKPKVAVVGTIKDVAGNTADTATVTAADGIPPKFSLSMNRTYHKKDATVTITTDETLLAAPTVTVTKQIATTGTTIGALSGEATAGSLTATGAKTYTQKVTIGTAPIKLNIQVSGNDVLSNTGTGGKSSTATTGAVTFQLDNVLNNQLDPEFTVAGTKIYSSGKLQSSATTDAKIEAVDPLLITVAFNRQCSSTSCASGGEKTEYSGDTHKTVELTKNSVSVTLSDGTKQTVVPVVSSADNITFTLAITDPPIGTYAITLNAKDEAGNVSTAAGATTATEMKAAFQVIKPKAVSLGLNPGWNLISLPFSPANPAINSVIGASHPASLVMAYDNSEKLWMVSRRDADTGLFTGDVTVITASTAYFVYTNSLEPIKILRPGLATASAAPSAPPVIYVTTGWNLVSILSNDVPLPKGVAADSYFGTLTTGTGTAAWLKTLVWKTATQTWLSISPGAIANTNSTSAATSYTDRCGTSHTVAASGGTVSERVCIGEGVWLWSTVDSVIIP